MKLFEHRKLRPGIAVALLAVVLLVPATFAGEAVAATPTPVLLGTTSTYAVLAGSGITNTGATTIVGNVGSYPTPTESGFASVTLTGTNDTTGDAATQQAKTDLTTAYNDAAGQTPTALPAELGGQTLTAGVYDTSSGAFGMTGTLVLDGQGDPDSIFIFQTGSTLITAGAADVSLINGAQACNIFWQVGSSATLGAASTLQGTVLANTSISLDDGVTVDGRLLAGEQASGSGAVSLIGDTITTPSVCLTATPVTTTTTTVAPTTAATTTTTATTAPTAVTATAPPTAATTRAAAKATAAKATAAKAAALKAAAAKDTVTAAAAKAAAAPVLAKPALTSSGFTG